MLIASDKKAAKWHLEERAELNPVRVLKSIVIRNPTMSVEAHSLRRNSINYFLGDRCQAPSAFADYRAKSRRGSFGWWQIAENERFIVCVVERRHIALLDWIDYDAAGDVKCGRFAKILDSHRDFEILADFWGGGVRHNVIKPKPSALIYAHGFARSFDSIACGRRRLFGGYGRFFSSIGGIAQGAPLNDADGGGDESGKGDCDRSNRNRLIGTVFAAFGAGLTWYAVLTSAGLYTPGRLRAAFFWLGGFVFVVQGAGLLLTGCWIWPECASASSCGSCCASATYCRRSENVLVLPVVIAELELGHIERKVLAADLVIGADYAASSGSTGSPQSCWWEVWSLLHPA